MKITHISLLLILLIFAIPLHAQDTSDTLNADQMISQTVDDVTFTITQSYADAQQFIVWYEIDGLDLPDENLMGTPFIFLEPRIRDDSMSLFGGGGGSMDRNDDGTISGMSSYEMDFANMDAVDLVVTARIYQPEGTRLWAVPDDFNMSSPDLPSDDYLYELPYDLTFDLPLSVLPYPEQQYTTDLSAESNDLNLAINQVSLTPLFAEVDVCFDLPSNEDWQPDLVLEVDGLTALSNGYSLVGLPTGEETSRCTIFRFMFEQPNENPQTLTFTIDRLIASVPDVISDDIIERAQTRLADLDIIATYNPTERSINFEVIEYPEDMEFTEANLLTYHALRDEYDAQWEFTLDLTD